MTWLYTQPWQGAVLAALRLLLLPAVRRSESQSTLAVEASYVQSRHCYLFMGIYQSPRSVKTIHPQIHLARKSGSASEGFRFPLAFPLHGSVSRSRDRGERHTYTANA